VSQSPTANIEQRWGDREKLLSKQSPSEGCGAELEAYDSKVHSALLEMQLHMGQQLARLGVPFFDLDPSLVVNPLDTKDGSRVSTERLRELQRKMLDYLESMYGP
jgi:Protein of unknown function (DUF2458)